MLSPFCLQEDKVNERIIRVLPEIVQNKIAAGEVIERPASVVKELVENSLDAGADAISIEVEEGGQRLLRVTDNGCGMDEKNLALSIERHATSKIRDVEDIFKISSMGFRGEALPSIGSVAKLTITSATDNSGEGRKLVVEGGKVLRLTPAAANKGTVVEAQEIFFNTPARRKFMKSASAEMSAINETVTRLALAHPQVSFRLDNGGKRVLELRSDTLLANRIRATFGSGLGKNLLPVKCDREGITLDGFCGKPPESRANSRGIYLFLNKRWIRHPGMARVILDAYKGSLPPRRYPFAVIFITLDPDKVDVNVHPAKEEVRFEDERMLTGILYRAVENSLQSLRESSLGEVISSVAEKTEMFSIAKPLPQTARPASLLDRLMSDKIKTGKFPTQTHFRHEEKFLPSSQAFSFPKTETETLQPEKPREVQEQAKLSGAEKVHDTVLAQAGKKYLLLESSEGITFVDQHALHERWNYEKLKDKKHPVNSQKLLIPLVIELSPREIAVAEEGLPVLRDCGFSIEVFGVSSLSVSAVPEIVKLNQAEEVVRDMLSDLANAGNVMEGIREKIVASLACRSAVLFGKNLSREEMLELIQKFREAKQPLTCPHGRPTTITITWEELEKRFGRR
jgi:DNA mismatch repair protein MutL